MRHLVESSVIGQGEEGYLGEQAGVLCYQALSIDVGIRCPEPLGVFQENGERLRAIDALTSDALWLLGCGEGLEVEQGR